MKNETSQSTNGKAGFTIDQRVCVSIITSTHLLEPERRTDQLPLKWAIEQVENYLQEKYQPQIAEKLKSSISHLYNQIDFNHNKQGLGLYVSTDEEWLEYFPFEVTEKISIGEHFALRESILKKQYEKEYYALMLTAKYANLFKGSLDILAEIKDANFPVLFKDNYEYNFPSRGPSFTGTTLEKGYEKDKSIIKELRLQSFLNTINKSLEHYMKEEMPLFVLSGEKEFGYFNALTHHINFIYINENPSHKTENELSKLTWKYMQEYLDQKENNQIAQLKEKRGTSGAEEGIENCWKAVVNGRCLTLFVEKDLIEHGYINDNDGSTLFLYPPKGSSRTIGDVAEEMIRLAIDKNSKVMVVGNGKLDEYGRVALLCRY